MKHGKAGSMSTDQLRELFTQFMHDIYDITDEFAEKNGIEPRTTIKDFLDEKD